MAEYVYENNQGQIAVCGDFDFARRALLEDNGYWLVEIAGDELLAVEDMPDLDEVLSPFAELEPDESDE